ncbi:adenine nucleotide alpha hydrolases-like protein [Hesseltinella vesiculosa]|uniref:FAD synthase n=1 Tax=Hesseltinella vesiculosa TaxID=101127 RepID=A0A1X2GU24_9FUNG|nr:adenine nucleotide alpha hydrolases-like protein [Hesseltinella vesiculosa]
MHAHLAGNHGCTLRPIDPFLDTVDRYDFSYIEKTVYEASQAESPLGHSIRAALQVIEEAYERFGLDGVTLSFNGGKDCTVLLHLVAAVLSRKRLTQQDKPIRTVYVTYPNPFPHVDAFVDVCAKRYHLDCVAIPGPMRQALQHYLDISHPKPKAIFVGIRRNDPYAENLTYFDPTDEGWPSFIRCHPIINWSFKQIWDFLLLLKVPYCSLYDQGYTSLGSMENTHPNPDLKTTEEGRYQPAYMLENELHERCGRTTQKK